MNNETEIIEIGKEYQFARQVNPSTEPSTVLARWKKDEFIEGKMIKGHWEMPEGLQNGFSIPVGTRCTVINKFQGDKEGRNKPAFECTFILNGNLYSLFSDNPEIIEQLDEQEGGKRKVRTRQNRTRQNRKRQNRRNTRTRQRRRN